MSGNKKPAKENPAPAAPAQPKKKVYKVIDDIFYKGQLLSAGASSDFADLDSEEINELIAKKVIE